jgi:hypothetical protein
MVISYNQNMLIVIFLYIIFALPLLGVDHFTIHLDQEVCFHLHLLIESLHDNSE